MRPGLYLLLYPLAELTLTLAISSSSIDTTPEAAAFLSPSRLTSGAG
ncbi:MAG: hypothetical protein WKH64_12475 [Chloroflexia bacterium]